MSVSGKMRFIETLPGMEGGGIKENDGGGEFSYFKNFCKCHNVPQYNN
jgi:hypothetical protein